MVRGLSEYDVARVIHHFRSLEFGGTAITVDEAYIRVHNLLPNILERPFQLVPRQSQIITNQRSDASKKRSILESNNTNSPVGLCLPDVPADEYNLMKTEFLCVDNLPKNIAKAALIFDISRTSDGCVIIPYRESSRAFIYYPDCETDEWKAIIFKFIQKLFNGKRANVYEVYLQTGQLTSNGNLEV